MRTRSPGSNCVSSRTCCPAPDCELFVVSPFRAVRRLRGDGDDSMGTIAAADIVHEGVHAQSAHPVSLSSHYLFSVVVLYARIFTVTAFCQSKLLPLLIPTNATSSGGCHSSSTDGTADDAENTFSLTIEHGSVHRNSSTVTVSVPQEYEKMNDFWVLQSITHSNDRSRASGLTLSRCQVSRL